MAGMLLLPYEGLTCKHSLTAMCMSSADVGNGDNAKEI